MSLPEFQTTRGPMTTLLNEPALLTMIADVRARVAESLSAGSFPVLFGGDCSLLLGAVPGMHDALGSVGLLFVDGHEDTTPLDVSEDGEAANCEIGLLLGLTGRISAGRLMSDSPALDTDQLAMVGQRDHNWRRQYNVGSVANLGAW